MKIFFKIQGKKNPFYICGEKTDKLKIITNDCTKKGIISSKTEYFRDAHDLIKFLNENPNRIFEHIAEYI